MHGNFRRSYLFGGSGSKSSAGAMPEVASLTGALQSHPSDQKTNDAVDQNTAATSFVVQQQQQQQHLLAQTSSALNSSSRTFANHFGRLSPAQHQQQHRFCSNTQQRSSHKMLDNYADDDCSQLDPDQYASQLRNLSIQSRSITGRSQADQMSQHYYADQSQASRFGGRMQSTQQQQHLDTPQRSGEVRNTIQQQLKWTHPKSPQQHSNDQMHNSANKAQNLIEQQVNATNNNNKLKQPNRQQSSSASSSNTIPSSSSSSLRVNFNRDNRADDGNEQQGESRKKKYLTAKYGQQQMNLIKKRLKIETWLHEQLQELAKSINAEAELDEIDIDLDQLLDMEDDETRQHWLKKTLQPFDRLPSDKLNKFICEVLEQSKLL